LHGNRSASGKCGTGTDYPEKGRSDFALSVMEEEAIIVHSSSKTAI
jgi:hypothetical protein